MAKALVFSGAECPVCKTVSGYGMLESLGEIGEHAMKTIQGAAIGAGAVIATDMVIPKILPTLSGTLRTILQGGIVILGSYALKDKNPELATGIAVGGGAVIAYKLLGSLLKLPMAGLSEVGAVMPEEISAVMPEEISAVMPEEVSGLGEDNVEYVLGEQDEIVIS